MVSFSVVGSAATSEGSNLGTKATAFDGGAGKVVSGARDAGPSEVDGLLLEGQAFLAARKYTDALTTFRKAEVIDPGNQRVLVDIASVLADLGRTSESISYYSTLGVMFPDAGWADVPNRELRDLPSRWKPVPR